MTKGYPKGKYNTNYKTGRYKTSHGYYAIWSGYNKREYEHKMVFQLYHMCCLLPNAIIHHINGIKTDNRIENLELTDRRKHREHHFNTDDNFRETMLSNLKHRWDLA